MEKLQELIKQIEKEESFEKSADLFAQGAVMIKELCNASGKAKGKIVEIIKDMDAFIEKELKV